VNEESAPKRRFKTGETDFLLIFLPVLAAVTLFVLVLSDKFNIKILNKNFAKDVVYQRNVDTTKKALKPVIQDDLTYTRSAEVFKKLENSLTIEPGFYGLYIKDLGSNTVFKHNADTEFYAASLYKIPIAAAVMKEIEKGKLSLDSTATYLPYDYSSGTGVIGSYTHGIEIRIGDILSELLKNSDNTAQNILLRTLTYKNVSEAFDSLVPDKDISTFYRYNLSTPEEVGLVIEKLYYGDYIKKENSNYLFDLMTDTSFEDRIKPYLREDLKFSHKIGSWPDTWHDCGVVSSKEGEKEVIVCLMSQKASFENFINASKMTAEFVNVIME
jgi:beta-lactamase class A